MKYLITMVLLIFAHFAYGQNKKILNDIHKDSVRFYIGFQKANERFNYIEAVQKFTTLETGSILERVDLHRAIIPVNNGESKFDEPASTTFLLKIYDIDNLTGQPGASLIKEPLIIRNAASPIIKIDLKKYKIFIPGTVFFVGIEWLFTNRNERLMQTHSIELVPGRNFGRVAKIYQPFLGMVKNKKTTSDAWVMTPDGKWKLYTHNLPYMTDLSITAHVLIN